MKTHLYSPLHRGWLLLVAATIVGYLLRVDGAGGPAIGAATLAIACWKGRLVLLDFMELRHAPLLWRALVEGWLTVLSLNVFAVYAGH